MIYKFTNTSKNAMEIANQLAIDLGHNYVGTEHLLYGLIKEGKGVACKVLENQAITADLVYKEITEIIGKSKKLKQNTLGFTPRTKRVIENSFKEAKKNNLDYIGTEHILLGIIKEGDSIAVRILLNLNINTQKLYNDILKITNEDLAEISKTKEILNKEKSKNTLTPTLNQYGIDLTKQAREGKLDPVIGRNTEIERVIQILSRRSKNNPCLIGEPGVGKTAVIEGLAEKIISGDVPDILKDKKIITIDISSMVAGAKYRGDFEERIKKALNEVKKVEDIILFIDEIHTIVGAGSAEGAIDAANILKPMLARGEIQLIGATTTNEYRKYIEKDAALERRFSKVDVNEPTKEETIKILKGLRDKYESHHNLKITDEAIIASVELSSRYINDRFLPDKAIDLIDEAASSVKIKAFKQPEKIKELEKNIEEIKEEKEESIKVQNFEKAALLRNEEEKLNQELEQEKDNWNFKAKKELIEITTEDIADIVAKSTGIPVQKINESETEKLRNLEETLHKRIIGQEEAVKTVAKAIKRSRVGLRNPERPISSFIFLGPTGVGKTELSKAVAESLFGNENEMIRIDMSEYMESNSVSKLIGAPPGYVGFDEGGWLTEKVRRKPYSVILFDEIEKAHPDIMNILLQILEDGRLTDSQGRTVNFKNTIIIMTSNIGARTITNKNALGFTSNNQEDVNIEYENIKKEVINELKHQFRPEFINRIDEIIVFRKLTKEELKDIIKIMLTETQKRLEENNINIKIEESTYEKILEQVKDLNYGARPLRKIIQTEIEDKITDQILNGDFDKKM